MGLAVTKASRQGAERSMGLGPVVGPLVHVREADVLLFDWFAVVMVPEWMFVRVLVYTSLTLLANL